MKIRNYRNDDADFMKEMLLEAIYENVSVSILQDPNIKIYYEDFGTKAYDYAKVMTTNSGARIGLAWCRLIHGYGYVADDIPEVAIAIDKKVRNQGNGTKLLNSLIELAQDHNFTGLSLSVDQRNQAAVHLYQSAGFTTVDIHDETLIMKLIF